jgi:hypothetical protein
MRGRPMGLFASDALMGRDGCDTRYFDGTLECTLLKAPILPEMSYHSG